LTWVILIQLNLFGEIELSCLAYKYQKKKKGAKLEKILAIRIFKLTHIFLTCWINCLVFTPQVGKNMLWGVNARNYIWCINGPPGLHLVLTKKKKSHWPGTKHSYKNWWKPKWIFGFKDGGCGNDLVLHLHLFKIGNVLAA
jgi:hypothetical protein